MIRVLLSLISLTLLAPGAALAVPSAAATAVASADASRAAERSHDGGVVSGTVVGIDYVRGVMSVKGERNKTFDVFVLPSTNIQGKASGYSTIADLKKGANVEVFTSVVGSRTNAQIIKLK